MAEQLPDTELRRTYCGTPAGDGWLGIEVWREDGGGAKDLRVDVENIGFCTEDHAGRYFLDGRLPPPDFSEPETLPRTWRDRLFDSGVLTLFVLAAAFVVLGVWKLVDWIWS